MVVVAACGKQRGGTAGEPGDNAEVDSGPGVDVVNLATTFVYAHTATELYRIDPDTLAVIKVGDFDTAGDQITDIAINRNSELIGISFTSVYAIDPMTAKGTRLSAGLSGTFNGMSFVPAEQFGQVGDDILIATRRDDGGVFRIDPNTGATKQIGNMGAFSSSGDLVSVAGFGTMQTTVGSSGDQLVRLAPQSFAATPIGSGIGFSNIWGVAFWKNRVFGFTASGQFIIINPVDGKGTLVTGGGPAWWGAAVITTAPTLF
jgi:hypothetical protein